MKRFSSVILLVSLLVGILQPILPMINYQLHKGSIIELFGSGERNAESACQMTLCVMENCESREDQADQNLLDIDYYPVALEISAMADPGVFLSSTRFYLPIVKNITSPTFLPIPPPPRLS